MNEPDQLLIQLAVIEESKWIESFSIESGILILDRILGRWHRFEETYLFFLDFRKRTGFKGTIIIDDINGSTRSDLEENYQKFRKR